MVDNQSLDETIDFFISQDKKKTIKRNNRDSVEHLRRNARVGMRGAFKRNSRRFERNVFLPCVDRSAILEIFPHLDEEAARAGHWFLLKVISDAGATWFICLARGGGGEHIIRGSLIGEGEKFYPRKNGASLINCAAISLSSLLILIVGQRAE